MAPARKKRENQFFDVGKEGRKTGVTVAEQPKDKYGLEAIDNVFSSPSKPASRINGSNATLSSKDMDISRGSGVDPTLILTERRVLNSTKSHLAPPSSRSPHKTNIGSSPRRHPSIGPSAKHSRSSLGPPVRANGVRKLNFNQQLPPADIVQKNSPLRSDLHRGARHSTAANIYDLRESPEIEASVELYEHVDEESENQHDSVAILSARAAESESDAEIIDNPVVDDEDDAILANGEAPSEEEAAPAFEPLEDAEEPISSPMVQKKKRSQPRSNKATGSIANEEELLTNGSPGATTVPLGIRDLAMQAQLIVAAGDSQSPDKSRPAQQTRTMPLAKTSSNGSSSAHEAEHDAMPPPRAKRATKTTVSKKRTAEVVQNDTHQQKPAKRLKQTSTSTDSSRQSKSQTSSKLFAPPTRRPGPGQLTFLRQQTPAEELSTITRSGRRCVQPLQHWKLEKAERAWDGTIKSVERVEEIEVMKTKKKRQQRVKDSNAAVLGVQDEEEDDDLEVWEAEGGSVIGPVQAYNPEDGTSSYEMHEEEIALGRLSITTKEVHGANFKYGKIVSMDFFGAGLIDLPVDGFKSKKQTRKMHMSFFVAEGKVAVTVGATQFTISKGGTWQVPRGNSYSIENAGARPAKLFFAQANEKFIANDE